ncbi:alginate O-acetyltransferase AlgX-related protein [Actinokineospora sp. HUAS TT18]|uniref:alginate O-acetyltransferase AlgX-related protein n=1 Tax=Actinokineospora sp. HUAS TT18 TaxID=3447451 RepID=UPI003F51D38B
MSTDHAPTGALPPVHEAWLPREHSLHRPRHAKNQTFALLCAAVFFAAPALALGVGAQPAEIENRRIAEFPSPLDGWKFFNELPVWATDHIVFRKAALEIADQVSRGVFGEPPSFGSAPQGAGIGATPSNDRPALQVPKAIEGTDGWLYYGDDIAARCTPKRSMDETMARLRELREGVEASGRRFILIVAPDKSTVVPEHLPTKYVGQDCATAATKEFWRRVGPEAGAVDLRDELRDAGTELGKPVYEPLDGHWSDEGGIVLTRRLAEIIRPGVSDDWEISPGKTWEAPGDLPPLIGRSGTIRGTSYALKADGKRDQTVDMSANYAEARKLKTAFGPGTIGNSVGYLGDSFTIRAMRYLAATFSDLTLLHYGRVADDAGRAAGRMLADHEIVVMEIVERTLASGNSVLLDPEVVAGITRELAARPR